MYMIFISQYPTKDGQSATIHRMKFSSKYTLYKKKYKGKPYRETNGVRYEIRMNLSYTAAVQ